MPRDRSPRNTSRGLDRLRPYLVVPLITLVVVTLIARLIGLLLPDDGIGWVDALRGGLAAMFAIAATAHFGRARVALIQMVPPGLPHPARIVTLTGILEIAGVIGLIIPETARWVAICLVALLVAMFPANVQAARRAVPLLGKPATPLWFRTIVQLVFIVACALVVLFG